MQETHSNNTNNTHTENKQEMQTTQQLLKAILSNTMKMLNNHQIFHSNRDELAKSNLKSSSILEILCKTETLEMDCTGTIIFSREWNESEIPKKCKNRAQADVVDINTVGLVYISNKNLLMCMSGPDGLPKYLGITNFDKF